METNYLSKKTSLNYYSYYHINTCIQEMSDKPLPNQATPPVQMTPEERKAFDKYGRLPKQSQLLAKKDKKYFDSADWAKGQNSGQEPKLPKSPPGTAGGTPK